MGKIKIDGFLCERCHYKWISRGPVPVVCAKCHSPYWNRAKIKRKVKQK